MKRPSLSEQFEKRMRDELTEPHAPPPSATINASSTETRGNKNSDAPKRTITRADRSAKAAGGKKGAKHTMTPPNWEAIAKAAGWKEGGKRALGWEQLNVLVPGDVRRAAKAKASQTDRDLSNVVTDLLRQWISSTPTIVEHGKSTRRAL